MGFCATLDNLAAYRFRLFKRSNGYLCEKVIDQVYLSVVPNTLSYGSRQIREHCSLWIGTMDTTTKEKRNISTADAVKILRKSSVEIDEKKAEEVLELMYFLAKLIVNQNFKTWEQQIYISG